MREKNRGLARLNQEKKGIGAFIFLAGIWIYFSFASVDAQIFNATPPAFIVKLSGWASISPLLLDILTTGILIGIIALMRIERELGRLE